MEETESAPMVRSQSPVLSDLPENCISNILSLTTPSDVCRSSSVSTLFRSGGDSDYVWNKMLPPDYAEILAGSDFPAPESLSKKSLYIRLCSPILVDSGKKSFWLERSTGKKCYMLSAPELRITWGDDERYWTWDTLPESRFPVVAHLKQVCWFEISYTINPRMLSPHTHYMVFLVFKHMDYPHGFDESPPVEVNLSYQGRVITRNVCLHQESPEPAGRRTQRQGQWWFRRARMLRPTAVDCIYLTQRVPSDGWAEVELGEFSTEGGDEGDLNIHLMETKGGNWKGGIAIEGIELRPKRSG